jgi:hypothetical protein
VKHIFSLLAGCGILMVGFGIVRLIIEYPVTGLGIAALFIAYCIGRGSIETIGRC